MSYFVDTYTYNTAFVCLLYNRLHILLSKKADC